MSGLTPGTVYPAIEATCDKCKETFLISRDRFLRECIWTVLCAKCRKVSLDAFLETNT